MSLPYPVNDQNMVHMPDPDNQVTLPTFTNQPYGSNQMYPQLPPPELPYPQQGAMQLPPEPSQLPLAYPPQHMSQYPPQNYPPSPDNPMLAGYPPQNQMPYPPQNVNSYPSPQANIQAYPQPGYPSQPTVLLPMNPSFDEEMGKVDLNEGLLSRGGEMMSLGK